MQYRACGSPEAEMLLRTNSPVDFDRWEVNSAFHGAVRVWVGWDVDDEGDMMLLLLSVRVSWASRVAVLRRASVV